DTTVHVVPSEDERYLFVAYRGRAITKGVLVYVIEPASGALVWHTKVGSKADRVQLSSTGHKLRVHVRSYDEAQMWTVEIDPEREAISGMTSVPNTARVVRPLLRFEPDARHGAVSFGLRPGVFATERVRPDGPAQLTGAHGSWSMVMAEQELGEPEWLDDGRAVVSNYTADSSGVTLTALSPSTGALSWTVRLQGVGTLDEPVDDTKVRVSTHDRWVVVEGTQGDTSFFEVLDEDTGATVLHQVYPGS
ncbi:MAG: hypothetical protein AAGI01_17405, partial [Myxococcota bacterium]